MSVSLVKVASPVPVSLVKTYALAARLASRNARQIKRDAQRLGLPR